MGLCLCMGMGMEISIPLELSLKKGVFYDVVFTGVFIVMTKFDRGRRGSIKVLFCVMSFMLTL